jgi:mannose-1-phosphate guanylyltransferase
MKAMVLAAGLGTRLRPLTYEIPKPMVPVLDRPVMAHILGLLQRQGFDEVIANLHYFPDAVKGYFGDRIEYRYEEELLGTAGGVRNVADFFGDDPVVVISGDALTDVDLNALVERHRSAGGIATLTVKHVEDTQEYGVVIHDADGRIQGFQEKPHPDEALSHLGNCGIYCFSPEIFDYFPDEPFADWANDVFPALLDNDVPFHVHETKEYWNDVGSLAELRQGTWDALEGKLKIEVTGANADEGVTVGEGSSMDGVEVANPPVWVGKDVEIGSDVRFMGPVAVGDGCRIGDGAALRDTIVFPGTEVAAGTIAIGAIVGRGGIVEAMRSLDDLEGSA